MTTTELLSTPGQYKVKVATGNTYAYGDILKQAGFVFVADSKAWIASADDWDEFGGAEEWARRANPTYSRRWSNALAGIVVKTFTVTINKAN